MATNPPPVSVTGRSAAEHRADHETVHLQLLGGPIYTITGFTAAIPVGETAVANYSSITTLESAVIPTYLGERIRVFGYPSAAEVAFFRAASLTGDVGQRWEHEATAG